MLYTYKEAEKKFGSEYQLLKALKDNKIFKIEKGIYSDEKHVNYLALISKKYPNAIFTMDSAFFYHNLTDVIPENQYLAVKRDSMKIKDKEIVQIKVIDSLFSIGASELVVNGVKIKIYDKERMLIELIRNRKSIGFDYYKEIIANYRERKEELNPKKIASYISAFHHEGHLYDVIMREVY